MRSESQIIDTRKPQRWRTQMGDVLQDLKGLQKVRQSYSEAVTPIYGVGYQNYVNKEWKVAEQPPPGGAFAPSPEALQEALTTVRSKLTTGRANRGWGGGAEPRIHVLDDLETEPRGPWRRRRRRRTATAAAGDRAACPGGGGAEPRVHDRELEPRGPAAERRWRPGPGGPRRDPGHERLLRRAPGGRHGALRVSEDGEEDCPPALHHPLACSLRSRPAPFSWRTLPPCPTSHLPAKK